MTELRVRLKEAIENSMPGEMDMISDRDFADAADNVLQVIHEELSLTIADARATLDQVREEFPLNSARTTRRPTNADDMIDLVNVEHANVMIGELGHHLWVCTENGTVLRIKAGTVTLDDRRVVKNDD